MTAAGGNIKHVPVGLGLEQVKNDSQVVTLGMARVGGVRFGMLAKAFRDLSLAFEVAARSCLGFVLRSFRVHVFSLCGQG